MKWYSIVATLGVLSVVGAADSSSGSIAPIETRGNALFNSKTGERFYIRGVDYQPGGESKLVDTLADTKICSRDLPYFKELGINTLRVYTIDNTLDHDECMKMLADAGIYLLLDVNTPKSSISRQRPVCSYNSKYLENVFATVDAFAKYDNVLGFFAGNEVVNDIDTTFSATYVKAVVRDMKKYIKAKNYRQIPVGYSAADVSENRLLVAHYFNCGDDPDARIDMLGVNDYSWCSPSSFRESGWAEKVGMYSNYSVPVFLSEFGCNKGKSRPFDEIASLYSSQMSPAFSGGLVYDFIESGNNYGLLELDEKSNTLKKLEDFNNLKAQYAKAKSPSGDGGYSKNNKIAVCPARVERLWEAEDKLPPMPSAASAFFTSAPKPRGTDFMSQEICEDGNKEPNRQQPGSSSSSLPGSSAPGSSTTSSSVTSGGAVLGAAVPPAFQLLVKLADLF